MFKLLSSAFAVSILAAFGSLSPANANDSIYPPAPAASNVISFDGKGFMIDGQRTFLSSGGMEYARVPRALWRDRLLRMKRAGFNCTETYVFWNFHEPTENVWNFSGDHDLNAYLQLVHQLGMYAIVRIGPYVCAEWDSGGYPVWLRFKPGVVPREDNQPFLDETFKYYDKIVPIIAANQVNHGGSVILVQIENEYNGGWGTDHNSYEQKLRDRVLTLGIEVPTFFSGLNHGFNPAGDSAWDDSSRDSPWMTTEFWTTWYDKYGVQDPDPVTRGTWKILAYGGSGYNYYMMHGGTNFDYYNDDEDASSYDYGAAIGQAGDLRPLYYKFKEAALFAQSFRTVLANSANSSSTNQGIASNTGLGIYARTGPAGTIVFLDNPSKTDVTTTVTGPAGVVEPTVGAVTVPEQKMLPVVENYSVTPKITIDQSVTQILTVVGSGSSATLVVYGPAGGFGSLTLSSKTSFNKVAAAGWKATDPSHGILEITYPSSGANTTVVGSGADRLRIIAMDEQLADRTWPITTDQGTDLVVGPDYVGSSSIVPGTKIFHVEYANSTPGDVVDYTPDLKEVKLRSADPAETMPAAPMLTNWQQKTVDEDDSQFPDSGWLSSPEPPYMGADGDYSAYAWYRTTITAPTAKTEYFVPKSKRDRMILFIDGTRLPATDVSPQYATLNLTAGAHSLAVLTTHYGRSKLYGVTGPIDQVDAKGLGAPVILSDSPRIQLTDWQSQPPTSAEPDLNALPTVTDTLWQSTPLGTDVFAHKSGWAWYQTRVTVSTSTAVPSSVSVHFDCVDDNATIFCNGVQVGTHKGWDSDFDIDLTTVWKPGKSNVITVLDQNIDGAGGISGSVVLTVETSNTVLTGWKMRGGVGDPSVITAWSPLQPIADPAPPTFFQAHFNGQPPDGAGAYPILRVHLGGMSAGFVWLNGHNLGRYPEKIPVDGLYLPECWILSGDNTLQIFDEDGKQPTDVKLYTETGASRYDFTFTNQSTLTTPE